MKYVRCNNSFNKITCLKEFLNSYFYIESLSYISSDNIKSKVEEIKGIIH